MTNGEIIQRVQSLYSKGVQSDDSRLTPRHIYSVLISNRSRIISQQINRREKISQWVYQDIPCIELIKAPIHECPCLPDIGCTFLKSKYRLPDPLVSNRGHAIQHVTSIDGSIIYSETSWTERKYKSGRKYTSKVPDYFIRNGHLMISYYRGPKIVTMRGLFEDPLEVDEFINYCPDECTEDCIDCDSIFEEEFPLDPKNIQTLIEMSLKELLEIFSSSLEDITNNSTDSIKEKSK